MKIVRVTLDISVNEADLDSTAWDLRWSIGKVIKAEGTTPKQVIYYEEDDNGERTFIRYTEDFYIDLPYIEVYGENPSSIELVIEDIHDCLATHTISEAIEMVKNAKDREELFLAIRYLGIGCGGHPITTEVLELFKKLAQDSDPDVREVTRIAMVYAGAAELESIFEMMAQNDPDPRLRQQAAESLEGLRKYVINQPAS